MTRRITPYHPLTTSQPSPITYNSLSSSITTLSPPITPPLPPPSNVGVVVHAVVVVLDVVVAVGVISCCCWWCEHRRNNVKYHGPWHHQLSPHHHHHLPRAGPNRIVGTPKLLLQRQPSAFDLPRTLPGNTWCCTYLELEPGKKGSARRVGLPGGQLNRRHLGVGAAPVSPVRLNHMFQHRSPSM